MKEAVKKLCVEAVKVEEELKEAEAEASLMKSSLATAKQQNQKLKDKLGYLESQKTKVDNDFQTSGEDIICLVQKLETLTTCLATFQIEKNILKNCSINRENIKEIVVQRMKDWKLAIDSECGITSEEKTLTDAQQKVTSLRYKRDALLSIPEKVSFLQKSLDDCMKNKRFLKREVEMLQGCLMKKEQQLNHIRQEVHVYEQRNQDHASRLRREIDEVSAHNAWLSLELSQIEAKVTYLRDQTEA
ncbi:chromosome partition protein Smc-like isoform X3 [Scylla paramamosain]|uniref:chromosome partition protein Smc-like isoform X2 n=1 Tax=Scylla paramamosain TaxID=85552 RepID=UPI0030829B11